ncbi:hypothetical protein NQK81_03305 [Amycolatopsis roodepoortensis]|nr:hypothetical protein [Amycolatopsis roodepoortensis]UUV32497.1 hypothetical protein NQK81_03305 [Amycolatopsis roodepoortensis]
MTALRQRDLSASAIAPSDVVHSWHVERNEDTNYYVGGWLDYE